jgi:outer membrane protein OmpA-like peptidoglycan-associated protein
MSANVGSLKLKSASAIVSAGLALAMGIGLAVAEDASKQKIIRALKPQGTTRGLTVSPAEKARNAEDARFIDTLRNKRTRQLTVGERNKIATIAKRKPSIDLEVNFEFDSAEIGKRALQQITALGEALSSSDLKGGTFVLAGHTDAKGSDEYNQNLSERRAEAVKRFLVEEYNIKASDLVTVGYGETRLKNRRHPAAAENRRVQVVNTANN